MATTNEVPAHLIVYAQKKKTMPGNALAPTHIDGVLGWVRIEGDRRYRCQRNVAKGKWFFTPKVPAFIEEKPLCIDPVMGTPERADMATSGFMEA
jgi:hypothetical protein